MKTDMKRFSKKLLSGLLAVAVIVCSLSMAIGVFAEEGPYKVSFDNPIIPLFEGTYLDTADVTVQLTDGGYYCPGIEDEWTPKDAKTSYSFKKPEYCFYAYGEGVYPIDVDWGGTTSTVYFVVNKKGDYNFSYGTYDLGTLTDATMPKTTDLGIYSVSAAKAALPVFESNKIDLDNTAVEFTDIGFVAASNITWSIAEANANISLDASTKELSVFAAGLYKLSAAINLSVGGTTYSETKTIWVVANEKNNFSFSYNNGSSDITLDVKSIADMPAMTSFGLYTVLSSDPVLPMTAGYKVSKGAFEVKIDGTKYDSTQLTYTTSDASKVEVDGDYIYAKTVGATVITAKVNDSTKSLDIVVVAKGANEEDYTVYFKDFRASDADVSDFNTIIINENGDTVGEYSGNHAADLKLPGFVPYNTYDVCETIGLGYDEEYGDLDRLNTAYTVLNNPIVSKLNNYTISADMMLYTGVYSAVGLAGRISDLDASGKFVNGTSHGLGFVFTPNGADEYETEDHDITGVKSVNDFAYTDIASAAWQGVNAGTNYGKSIRNLTATFSGETATFANASLSKSDAVTAAVANRAGAVGFVTMLDAWDYEYTEDYWMWDYSDPNGWTGVPIALNFKVTLANVDVSGLPTEKVEDVNAEEKDGDYTDIGGYTFAYTPDTNSVGAITFTNGVSSKVVVPATVGGQPVYSVDYDAFFGMPFAEKTALQEGLYQLTISEGIQNIYNNAFRGLTRLEKVDFPSTLLTVNDYTFASTGITTATLPDSVTTIGEAAFKGCQNLRKVTLEKELTELTTIGKEAFANCIALESIKLPVSLESIGIAAFDGCTSLKEVYIYSNNVKIAADYSTTEGVFSVFSKDVTIYGGTGSTAETYAIEHGNKFVAIDSEIAVYQKKLDERNKKKEEEKQKIAVTEDTGAKYIFSKNEDLVTASLYSFNAGNNEKAGQYTLPQKGSIDYEDYPLNYIFANAFKNSPDKDRVYGVIIPEGYVTVGASAFADCINLRQLKLPNSLRNINTYAFSNTMLSSVTIPSDLAVIQDYAFYNSAKLKTVNFAQSATFKSVLYTIGVGAFQGTAIEEITLPINVKEVGNSAFANTPLKKVTITNPNVKFGETVFPEGAEIHVIAGSVTEANLKALGYAPVADVKDDYTALVNNSKLGGQFTYEVKFPAAVVAGYTGNGGNVVVPSIFNATVEGIATKNIVPTEIKANLFAESNDKFRVYRAEFPETVKKIGQAAFKGCKNLVSVKLPDTLTTIGSEAFLDCNLTGSIVLGVNVTTIGNDAFGGNPNITDITILNPSATIASGAFPAGITLHVVEGSDVESTIITLYGEGVTIDHIEEGKQPAIDEITDNKNYEFIADANTKSVSGYKIKSESKAYSEKVVIPANINGVAVETISADIFGSKPYSPSLKGAVISEGIKYIGSGAFSGACNLTRVSLPKSLRNIGASAFAETNIAGEIIIPENVTKIGANAFVSCSKISAVTILNPNAKIGDFAFRGIMRGATIRGYEGSTAQQYCKENRSAGLKFESLGTVDAEKYLKPGDGDEIPDYSEPEQPENPDEPTDPTQENNDDDDDNGGQTIIVTPAVDLTLIITIAAAALMLFLLLITVVIIIIIVAFKSDDDDDDDDDEDDEDEEEDEEE